MLVLLTNCINLARPKLHFPKQCPIKINPFKHKAAHPVLLIRISPPLPQFHIQERTPNNRVGT